MECGNALLKVLNDLSQPLKDVWRNCFSKCLSFQHNCTWHSDSLGYFAESQKFFAVRVLRGLACGRLKIIETFLPFALCCFHRR